MPWFWSRSLSIWITDLIVRQVLETLCAFQLACLSVCLCLWERRHPHPIINSSRWTDRSIIIAPLSWRSRSMTFSLLVLWRRTHLIALRIQSLQKLLLHPVSILNPTQCSRRSLPFLVILITKSVYFGSRAIILLYQLSASWSTFILWTIWVDLRWITSLTYWWSWSWSWVATFILQVHQMLLLFLLCCFLFLFWSFLRIIGLRFLLLSIS